MHITLRRCSLAMTCVIHFVAVSTLWQYMVFSDGFFCVCLCLPVCFERKESWGHTHLSVHKVCQFYFEHYCVCLRGDIFNPFSFLIVHRIPCVGRTVVQGGICIIGEFLSEWLIWLWLGLNQYQHHGQCSVSYCRTVWNYCILHLVWWQFF